MLNFLLGVAVACLCGTVGVYAFYKISIVVLARRQIRQQVEANEEFARVLRTAQVVAVDEAWGKTVAGQRERNGSLN